jgi:multidrug efflux pump subunit AcrA (membrane-fusion protein)
VPLTALRADAGTVYVLLLASDDAAPRRVEVEVVGSADGYAVVTGDVADGDRVVVTAP